MASIILFNPPAPGGKGFTREGRCTQEAGVWGTQWPPLSLATAAALLERDGHTVYVFDCPHLGMTPSDLQVIFQSKAVDFAIWSTATPTLATDLAVAGIIKAASAQTITAVFGTHVTARPVDALSGGAVDAVIRGEPEGIIREICRLGSHAFKTAPGISYRDGATGTGPCPSEERCGPPSIKESPDAGFLDPAVLPAPAWHFIDCHGYRLPLKGRPFLMVAPIRGCPYQCTFCAAPLYYGRKLRRRPIENILQEIRDNMEVHGIRDVFIWADTFTADRAYVREFCRALIDSRLPIAWTCNSRVDTVDEETLRLMKQAGLWMISYGIESGNDRILELCQKKMTVAQSRRAVLWAKEAGIRVAGHFIFGLPGETEETMARTLALSLELPLDIAQFYAAAPLPGTRLYEEAQKEGWLIEYTTPSQNEAAMNLPGLPASTVNRYRRLAFRKFYGRPMAMINLLSMAEWSAVKNTFAPLKRFRNWTR